MSFWDDLLKDPIGTVGDYLTDDGGLSDEAIGLLTLGGGYLLGDSEFSQPDIKPTGYQGKVKEYTAVRDRVPMQPDPNRRPGQGGRRYFSDIQYAAPAASAPPSVEEARAASQAQAQQLSTQNFRRGGLARLFNDPARQQAMNSRFASLRDRLGNGRNAVRGGLGGMYSQQPAQPNAAVQEQARQPAPSGGVMSAPDFMPGAPPTATEQKPTAGRGVASLMGQGFAQGGYLKGATDGMADEVPATIEGRQPARLSDGEFVIPADVVSHLGNGNSEAGAKVLQEMMSRVRKERTGNPKQGKKIKPEKVTPK